MDAEISRFYYNKTVCNDGLTHVMDDVTRYMGIKLSITERYFTDDEDIVLDNIIRDLERMKLEFIKIKESRLAKRKETSSDNNFDVSITQDLEQRDQSEL